MMCPEEDYSAVVETLAIDEILMWKIRVGKETKNHEYLPIKRIPERIMGYKFRNCSVIDIY